MSSNQQPPNMLYPVANGTVSSNPFVEVFNETRAPTTSDVNFPIQKRWFDKSTNKEWILVGFTTTSGQLQADWRRTSEPIEFTGGTGTAGIFPVSADVNGDILLESTDLSILITGGTNSLDFTTNGAVVTESFTVDAVTAPGVNPVTPTAGIVTVGAAAVAAHNVPIETRSSALHEYKIEAQYASSNATTNAAKVGLAAFSSAQFSVDANGFVSLAGGTTPPILGLIPDNFTAPGTSPVVPNGSGNITVTAAQQTNQGYTNVINVNSIAANTLTMQIQQSGFSPTANNTKNGVCHFNSADFDVDPFTGFVSAQTNLKLHWPTVIVGDTSNGANYSTIAAAVAATTSGATIAIQPGTYTENISLTSARRFVGLTTAQGATTIVGKMSDSGLEVNFTLQNITLQTNSDFFLELTGTNSTAILNNCRLVCSNNTGINVNNTLATVTLKNCTGDLLTTGIRYYTGTGVVFVVDSDLSNSGASVTASGTSGEVRINNSSMDCVLSTSSIGRLTIYFSKIGLSTLNTTAVTTAGTGVSNIYDSFLTSGTDSALSIGSGTTVNCYNTSFQSTNTNIITGAGTLGYSNLSFTNGSSEVINTTTQTANTTGVGKLKFFQNTGTTGTSVSKVMNFYEEGTFTPTLNGVTPGTTTYNTQIGYYTRFGNLCYVQGFIDISGTTATGSIILSGLPFTVKNQTNGNNAGSVTMNTAWTWPVGTTTACLTGIFNTNNFTIVTYGNGVGQTTLQCQNVAAQIRFTMVYQV